MFSLDFIPKDLEIGLSNVHSTKVSNKNPNKNFSQVLENQKENFKDPKTIDKKQEELIKNPLKSEKDSKYKIEEKILDEDVEILEEKETELIVLLQGLCSLLEELETNLIKLDEWNLESIEFKIDELSSLLAEYTVEPNNVIELTQGQTLIESIEILEEIVQVIEDGLEQYKEKDLEENTMDSTKGKIQKLDQNLNHLKTKLEDSLDSIMEIPMEVDEDLVVDIKNKKDDSFETEESMAKHYITIEKDEIEFFSEEDVNLQSKNTENIIPYFEIKDKNTVEEVPSLEITGNQDIDAKDLIYQIVDKAKVIIDNQRQEIKISLKPEVLGELVLKMEKEKGSLLAKIMVDNYRTKELIEANLYQLKQDMKENGLEIKTFEVYVGTNEDFQREKNPEFYLNKKAKKIKSKNAGINEIKNYDENVFQNVENIYDGEGQLNLFA